VSLATDGPDGYGVQHEKDWQNFSSSTVVLQKSFKNYYGLTFFGKFICYLPIGVPGVFCV